MPKIEKKHAQGFGTGFLYTLLVAIKNDLAAQKVIIDELHDDHAILVTQFNDIKAKYEAHRHSVAGAAAVGTAPSTAAAAAAADASTIAQNLATLAAVKTALTTTS